MNIGIIDMDLLAGGTRFPNLALMKISGYCKGKGKTVVLLEDLEGLHNYNTIFASKVFTKSQLGIEISGLNNVIYGGTGYFFDRAYPLPDKVEHHMPDYGLYSNYIKDKLFSGSRKRSYFADYLDYSIGFTTRGCFRKCNFCVNRNCEKVVKHSDINEFLCKSRKGIYLWDDNFFGFRNWQDIFDELEASGKKFQFRQGLDIRLLTKVKAKRLAECKRYKGDVIFAFDFLGDRDLIEKKLTLWRDFTDRSTKLYVLCAYESTDVNDIISIFERFKILMKYRCLPFIMRFDGWEKSSFRGMYINIGRWANQPQFYKKLSFREFCYRNQVGVKKECASVKYLKEFEELYPDIAAKYFDMTWAE